MKRCASGLDIIVTLFFLIFFQFVNFVIFQHHNFLYTCINTVGALLVQLHSHCFIRPIRPNNKVNIIKYDKPRSYLSKISGRLKGTIYIFLHLSIHLKESLW